MQTFSVTDFSGDTRYSVAVGRIRALETKLLSKRQFSRLATLEGSVDFMNELRGTDYADLASRNGQDLHAAFSRVFDDRMKLSLQIAGKPDVLQVLTSRADFLNLKLLLKKQVTTVSRPAPLSRRGSYDPEWLSGNFQSGRSLPEPLEQARRTALEDYGQHASTARMEMIVDRIFVEQVRSTFVASGIPFLRFLIDHYIDLYRIVLVLRQRWWADHHGRSTSGMDQPDLNLLPAGGFLPADKFAVLAKADPDHLFASVQYTPYAGILHDALELYRTTGELWLLEKAADDFITAFCKLTQYTSFGVEPLVAYLWFSLQEIRNLRLVLGGCCGAVEPTQVAKRLRSVYDA